MYHMWRGGGWHKTCDFVSYDCCEELNEPKNLRTCSNVYYLLAELRALNIDVSRVLSNSIIG
jgi:hypothetical protein